MVTQELYDWAAYAAPQAGEKTVKAVRLALGTPIDTMKVHNVDALLGEVRGLHPRPDPVLARAVELNAHNQGARYPGIRGPAAPASSYKRKEAEDAIRIAEALHASCAPLCGHIDAFWTGLASA
jgi:HEPN domain-containing protein